MKVFPTAAFERAYEKAPERIRRAFDKQVRLLGADLRHPSLRAKKYDESRGIWQARVTRGWRLYFTIETDTCYLLDMISHPK